MNIQNIQSQIQSTEQYKIRAKTETQQTANEIQEQVDNYDKTNPIGEEAEGIYSVSHDEEGNLKIDYKQPESTKQTMSVKADDNDKAKTSAPVATNVNSDSESEDDDEIEKLKKQREQIKQQLNTTADEQTKSQLRSQLQLIEMQIALKSAE